MEKYCTMALKIAISAVSAWFFAVYLNFETMTVLAAVIIAGLILICWKKAERKVDCTFAFLALLLSVVLILGKHMHIEAPYAGLIHENYITPYSIKDVFALVFLGLGFYPILSALYCISGRVQLFDEQAAAKKLSGLHFAAIALFMFAAWLPWLLSYYPAFFFTDTANSLRQAVGELPLNNRNPILYTLFIKFCILIGGGFKSGDVTASFAVYSIIQMLYMSACLSYMLCAAAKFSPIKKVWIYLMAAVFAFSPYVAANSIAMWKDPIFCASLVAYSVVLLEFAASKGEIIKKRSWQAKYLLLSLMVLFWRNNGFCAVIISGAFIFIFLIAAKMKRETALSLSSLKRIFLLTLAAGMIWGAVVVPGYRLLHIGTPKEETAGIMVNQMARVAAYEGKMSEADKEYLSTILPLEMYKDVYRPGSVDLLKWDGNFNAEALSDSRFIRTYISLLLKNPGMYFEAWELQTFGFWTLNQPLINGNTNNIGDPHNLKDEKIMEIGEYTLQFKNLIGDDGVYKYLPHNSWSVPVGIINWLMVYVCVCLAKRKQWHISLSLAPQLGVALGLIIGTPIYYLARYEAAAQFLLPIILLLLFSGSKKINKA